MALIVKDRVLETCSTIGLVDFTLTGAVTGYQRFSAIGNGNTTYYTAYTVGGSDWEVGIGTVGTSSLTRDTVLSSSTGSKINFSTSPVVWCDLPASQAVFTDSTGNIALNSITYTPSGQPTYLEGKVWYDSTAHTLSYFNDSTNAIVHIGQDLQIKVINNTGSTIANGSPVYITGTSSGQTYPNIALAKADVVGTSQVIGLTNGAITNGAIGYVTTQGGIDNVNTSSFTVGQTLYLSPYSAGQLMNTVPPTGTIVQVGIVSYVNTSTGKISVKQATPLAISASSINGTVAVANGGTGLSSTPANGQLDIGNGTGFTRSTLTAGANISITNTAGAITIIGTGIGAAVVQTDIGTNANQIPLNQYLGTMAWQDAKAVRLGGDAIINTLTVGLGGGSIAINTAIGYQVLFSNTTGVGNTANGHTALYSNTTGVQNTANGQAALYYNTTGSYNTANGQVALYYNTTGSYNTANGHLALVNNTTGGYNTANGQSALQNNTTGSQNTANGQGSLVNNTTGIQNTADGQGALYSNTTGNYNTASGCRALQLSTTGNNNTAVGDDALLYNNTGSNNTANGQSSLYSNTTGNNNTALGYLAGYYITTGSNNLVLGYNAQASAITVSNEITIGNSLNTVIRYPHAYSTVASLPSASTVGRGSRTFVTDALSPTFQATVTGGGAVFTPVYSDGTNWKVG